MNIKLINIGVKIQDFFSKLATVITKIRQANTKLTRSGKLATLAIPAVMLASSISLFQATPTFATPYNCSAGIVQNGGWATCNNGSGQYRVAIGCKNIFGFYENPVGPWKNVGQGSSNVSCSFGYSIQWAGYNLRD